MAWDVTADPTRAEEAIAWFRARVPLTKDQWLELTERARRRAFTVAGVAQTDMVAQVWEAIDKAVVEGKPLKDFKRDIRARLEAEWGGRVANPSQRLDTIFRTNIQMAYQAGRWRQMTEPAVLEARPYWQYDAVLDKRTTAVCRGLDGTVMPAESPWWKDHHPPLHFSCRSGVITLSPEDAAAAGIAKEPPAIAAKPGFGQDPDQGEWQPAPDRWPAPLQAVYNRQYRGGVPAAPEDLELLPGVHYGPVTGPVSERRRTRILRAANALRLDGFLKEYPVGSIEFVPNMKVGKKLAAGSYSRDYRAIRLNSSRIKDSFGFGFLPQALPSVSHAAESRDRAIGRSFVHELGHHILHWGFTDDLRKILRDAHRACEAAGNFVSEYARDGGRAEYFCECLAAYRFHKEEFEDIDPDGYKMIETVLEAIRKQFLGS